MKKGMVFKRILATMSVIGMILSPMSAMTVQAEGLVAWSLTDVKNANDPVGFRLGESSTETGRVVYCLNKIKEYPGQLSISANDAESFVDGYAKVSDPFGQNGQGEWHIAKTAEKTTAVQKEAFRRKLIAIMHYGYGGGDTSYVKNTIGLTDDRLFFAATQYAIWANTDAAGVVIDSGFINKYKDSSAQYDTEQILKMNEAFTYLKGVTLTPEQAQVYELEVYATTRTGNQVKNNTYQNLGTYKPVDKSIPLNVSKKALTGTDELPGAEFKLQMYDLVSTANGLEEGYVDLCKWTSGDQPKDVTVYKGKSYKLTETVVPKYYGLVGSSNELEFSVDNAGRITLVGTVSNASGGTSTLQDGSASLAGNTITVFNKQISRDVVFSKKALGQTEELKGAEMSVTPLQGGSPVDTWISGGDVHTVVLTPGEYVFTENAAPLGYDKAESIRFKVTNDFKLEVYDPNKGAYVPADNAPILMYDRVNSVVEFSKTALTGGPELVGAHLEVKNSDGSFVEKWISTSTPHKIVGLTAGEYTLTETTAPAGYEVAETISFKLELDKDEKYIIKQFIDGAWKTVDKIVMKDAYTPTVTVKFNKTDKNGGYVKGAKLRVVEGEHASYEAAMKATIAKDNAGKDVIWTSENKPEAITLTAFKSATGEPNVLYYTFVEETAPDTHILTKEVVNFRLVRESNDGNWTAKMQVKENGKYKDAWELTLVNLPKVGDPGTTITRTTTTVTPTTPTTPATTPVTTPTPTTPVAVNTEPTVHNTPVVTTTRQEQPEVAGAVRGQTATAQVLGATRVTSPNTADNAPITLLLFVMGACVACALVCYIRWAQTARFYANKRRPRRTAKTHKR